MKYLLIFILVAFYGCQPETTKSTSEAREYQALSLSGIPLYPIQYSQQAINDQQLHWERAYNDYKADPTELNHIIWLGRRTAYLQRYREAIDVFSKGLEIHPQSAQLLRHRGHRYITIRHFEKAIEDLQKAATLMKGVPLEVETDGIPNKFNIPLSNTQFNIHYHLGLAYYLTGDYDRAVEAYGKCLNYCNNDDLLVATVDWMYMALRRSGKNEEARQLLERIHEDMKIIENDSYFKRLLMYKKMVSPESLLKVSDSLEDRSLVLATQGYGLGNWYWYNQEQGQAVKIFEQVIGTGHWAAFGYIAAEADLYNLMPDKP